MYAEDSRFCVLRVFSASTAVERFIERIRQ